MKKFILVCLSLVALFGCANRNSAVEENGPAAIRPLPSGIDLEHLTDATVPASFSCDDINWRGSSLTMTVFSEDLYDAVQINQMKVGDTLYYAGSYFIVKDIKINNRFMTVNDGIEEGGADLEAYAGGTYRAVEMDDHSIYSELGKVTLPLSQNFTIVDCGVNPEDPSITISDAPKAYLDTVRAYKKNFIVLDTTVEIQDSEIVNITRRWIP